MPLTDSMSVAVGTSVKQVKLAFVNDLLLNLEILHVK